MEPSRLPVDPEAPGKGDEVVDRRLELVVQALGLVGFGAQAGTAHGGAVHGEVDPGLSQGTDDLVLDLVLGAGTSRHRTMIPREDVVDLPHRVRRPVREGVAQPTQEGAIALDRIVLHHQRQHARVVGVDPEGQAHRAGGPLQDGGVGVRQLVHVGFQPLGLAGQPRVVHPRARDHLGEELGEAVVVGERLEDPR